jgi:antitoxin (DNA-binding transcriptional repressor) of toxin-antitoxin stability system
MQTETIELNEAQAHFQELVHRVISGIHVVLSQDQKPIAHIFPVAERVAGLHSGAIWTSDDFDLPLSDKFWLEGK